MGSESKGLTTSSSWSPATKKMIQNVKEIVNCPESEIYAALKDCNMDPDDAVQRLLSQDTFHEVKSKRERKKELKETQESRPRPSCNGSSARGIRGATASERSFGWSGSIQSLYNENGYFASNHKGENMPVVSSSPPHCFTSHVEGETLNHQPSTFCSGYLNNALGASHCHDSEPGSASNFSDIDCSASLSNDAVAVSSAAAKLQHLDLEEAENNCTIILPSHLRALAADCPHLSFGTFGSRNNSTLTSPLPADPLKDLRESSTTIDVLSSGPLETRNIGYAADESIESFYNSRKVIAGAPSYNLASSFVEEVKEDVSDESLGSEDIRPSIHDTNVENIERLTAALSFASTDPIVTNHSIQTQPAFIESQPTDVLMSKPKSLHESESLQAQFLASQSIRSRYGNTVSSLSSTPISFSEDRQPPHDAFYPSLVSSIIPNQHRVVPSYSQPDLSFKQPSNNAMSYSGHSQFPLTFHEKAHPGRDDFLQYLADLKSLPQYGASVNRFLGPSGATGYGSYGTSSNVHGSYSHNSLPPMVANDGYNNGFRPQNSDRHLFTSLHQNNSGSTWNHGSGSRMQDIASNSVLGHNQHFAGYRQDQQQPLYNHGVLGYSDHYRSQPEAQRDHQLQHFGGSTVAGAGDLSSQKLHQFWQQH